MKSNDIVLGMKIRFKSKSCGYAINSSTFKNSEFLSAYKKHGYAIIEYIYVDGYDDEDSYVTIKAVDLFESFDFLVSDLEPYFESATVKTLFNL